MNEYPYEYSEKELKLIEALGFLHVAKNPSIPPYTLYTIMAMECFRKCKVVNTIMFDKISTSVRKCLLAQENSFNGATENKILRLTKEFDDLIII